MGIRHFGFLADTSDDGAVDEAQQGDCAEGDADDGSICLSFLLVTVVYQSKCMWRVSSSIQLCTS